MIKRLLVVCGPTCTGKTKLAISLAKKYNGELVSSDSRQVYTGMDVGTGKDINKNSKFKIQNSKLGVCYNMANIPLWGYDLVGPKENFSVSQYFDIARKIITNIWERGHLPIIVGGTGLYIKSLIDGIDTSLIPPDSLLRLELGKLDADVLFEILSRVNAEKARLMNRSDRRNPRRLIRAIEIAYGKSKLKIQKAKTEKKIDYDSLLMIGLKAPRSVLGWRIEKRVNERIEEGFEKEVSELIKKGINWNDQSMQATGYRQYEDYHKGAISWEEFITRWISDEQKYAKRQMTWFNKDKRIYWIDISSADWQTVVEKKLQSWYHERKGVQ